jgi:hypothetical protein
LTGGRREKPGDRRSMRSASSNWPIGLTAIRPTYPVVNNSG